MSARTKLDIGGFAAILTLANLSLFLLFFVPFYVLEKIEISTSYEYLRAYADEMVRWLLPVVSAAVIAVKTSSSSFSSSVLPSFLISLSNLSYTLPYYYLLGIAYGGDTPESVLLSLAISVIYVALFSAYVLLLVLIIRSTLIHFTVKELQAELPKIYAKNPPDTMRNECIKKAHTLIPTKISEGKTLDFSSPATLAVFFAALMQFLIYFVMEIISVISYLAEVDTGYKSGEIFYIIFRFVFIMMMLFICHSVAVLAKRHAKSELDNSSDEDN